MLPLPGESICGKLIPLRRACKAPAYTAGVAFPSTRLRRLRRTPALRGMVRETRVAASDLIQPLFVRAGSGPATPIPSLDGQHHHSIDTLVEEARAVHAAGVPAVILFGLPDHKDD